MKTPLYFDRARVVFRSVCNQIKLKLMKLLPKIAVIAGVIAVFLGSAGVAMAAPYNFEFWDRSADDTFDLVNQMPQEATSSWALMGNGTGNADGSWFYVNGDNGITVDAASSEDAPYQSGNFQLGLSIGYIQDKLDISTIPDATHILSGKVSTSTEQADVIYLQEQLDILGSPFNLAALMGNNASTSPYVASSTQNGFMSASMLVKLNSLSTSTPAFSTPTRTIVTSTGSAGTQLSTTRNTDAHYNITIATTASIGGSAAGTVVLEIAPTNSATPSDWVEIARCTNSQAISLALALQSVQTVGCELNGMIPSGYYEKIRSINTSGTPTFTYNSGQEIQM